MEVHQSAEFQPRWMSWPSVPSSFPWRMPAGVWAWHLGLWMTMGFWYGPDMGYDFLDKFELLALVVVIYICVCVCLWYWYEQDIVRYFSFMSSWKTHRCDHLLLFAMSTIQFVCDLYLQGCSSRKSYAWIVTMLKAMASNIPFKYKVCRQHLEGLRPYPRRVCRWYMNIEHRQVHACLTNFVFSTAKCCVGRIVDPYGVNHHGSKSMDAVHGLDRWNWRPKMRSLVEWAIMKRLKFHVFGASCPNQRNLLTCPALL